MTVLLTKENIEIIRFAVSHILLIFMCLSVVLFDPIFERKREAVRTVPFSNNGMDSILLHLPRNDGH